MRGLWLASFASSVTVWAGAASRAHAGPDSEVTSSFDPGHGVGVHTTVDYDFSFRRSAIWREHIVAGAPPGSATTMERDLLYSSSRHSIIPRLEIGLFHDVWIYGALPVVVTDQRELEFDQRDTPCTFQPGGPCINRTNSSTIRDGILPLTGFDAHDPVVGFTDASSSLIFRGPDRHGLDQVHLGLGWAPMNQRRDDTKPTWKVGGELRVAVGKPMRLERGNPLGEVSVGQGVHEVRLWTTIARRRGWSEPYVELWWQAPIANAKKSLFKSPGFGSERTEKQQEAGVHFGFEAIAVDNQLDGERFSLDFSGRFVAHFEGRAYSEMWEVFAFAGDPAAGGPLVLDQDPTVSGMQAMAHPGITNVENSLEMGGQVAARAELGPRVHLAAIGAISGETQHIITFTDAGVDLPTCKGSALPPSCEADSNELVNSNTIEVNPLHVPRIDLVGHRYRSIGAMNIHIGAELQILF